MVPRYYFKDLRSSKPGMIPRYLRPKLLPVIYLFKEIYGVVMVLRGLFKNITDYY